MSLCSRRLLYFVVPLFGSRLPKAADLGQGELSGYRAKQPVLFAFHLAAFDYLNIIKTCQVQHPMNDVACQLALPGRMKSRCLRHSLFDAHEDFTADRHE